MAVREVQNILGVRGTKEMRLSRGGHAIFGCLVPRGTVLAVNERPDHAHEDSVRSGPTETEHSQPRDRPGTDICRYWVTGYI